MFFGGRLRIRWKFDEVGKLPQRHLETGGGERMMRKRWKASETISALPSRLFEITWNDLKSCVPQRPCGHPRNNELHGKKMKKVIIWLSQSPTASTVCNTTHGHVGFRLPTMLFLSSPELPNGCNASGAEASRPATVHTVISDLRSTVLHHFQTHLCNSSSSPSPSPSSPSSSSSKPFVSSVLEGPLHTWFIMLLD